MPDTPLDAFESPSRHADVSAIIRRRSTNAVDVRAAILHDLNLSTVRRVLDLGCGFGFMAEAIAPRTAPDAEFTGVDACAANQQPYLACLGRAGRRGRFLRTQIGSHLGWPDASFDLVVASYSLYFFPEVLPDVARVLAPTGLLLAITHTENSCRSLLHAAGLHEPATYPFSVIQKFSADNAAEKLAPCFEHIERVDYQNELLFEPTQYDDFLRYLWFKLPFLSLEVQADGTPAEPLANAIRAALAMQPRIRFEKNDAAFYCRGPRCG